MNHYSTLGVTADATADEIRQAYLVLAKKYHPDKNSSPAATEMMAEINLAYETLRDEQRRKQYDLENGIVAEPPAYVEDDEEIGQDQVPAAGRCFKCNFVNSSGLFVCSVCGYTFKPESRQSANIEDEEEPDAEENLSEIIRCPQCNEINMYSRGSCWQCGLQFEIDEAA
jgi:curved DNA-binding protein CbpA